MSSGTHVVGSPGLCRILSLDGGGAKGFYTLGVLREIEAMMLGQPLCEHFDLIFGTSTGGIIAALLALGHKVDDIHTLYKDHVPTVMRHRDRAGRSKALAELAKTVFGDHKFTDVKTGVGIVATHWELEKPMIFKGSVAQAHGRRATFVPGFGCTIADAVVASCSAYPFFTKHLVTTADGKEIELIDGGYCANNPTLYAIADAVKALEKSASDLRVVSLGVGMDMLTPGVSFIQKPFTAADLGRKIRKLLADPRKAAGDSAALRQQPGEARKAAAARASR